MILGEVVLYKKYTTQLKKLYEKFLKLPIYYKVLTSILMSLFLHFSFSLLFYIGLYNYTYQYNIPFLLIEELNLNLLIIPLYFDALVSTLIMLFIMLFTILVIRFGPTLEDFGLKKKSLKQKTINYYIIKLYKWCKKKDCKYYHKKHILFILYSSLFILAISILPLSFFLFTIDGVFKFLIMLIPPIIIGISLESKLQKNYFKILLLSTIFFLLLSFTVALTSHSVKTYLEKTSLGGEIPISLKIKKDFHDGYLILMTKEKILLMDVNKSMISEIAIKTIDKINYPIQKNIKKWIEINSSRIGGSISWGKYPNFSEDNRSEEINKLTTPNKVNDHYDFSILHH